MEENYGFSEEEIEELSEFDEEWGHLKTKAYPESMTSEALIEEIENDPNHEVFFQYTSSPMLLVCQIPLVAIFTLVLAGGLISSSEIMEASLTFGGVLLFSFLGSICVYYLEKKTQYIVANGKGIGWKEYNSAIEWDHVHWVDIGIKKGKIERVVFSGNRRSLYLDNDWLNTEITLSKIQRYLPDLETWKEEPMVGWPSHYTRYKRPESVW